MEDNQTLLMLVLKQHYRDKPKVLDDALLVIKEYSSKECNEMEYDKTLHVLQDMMNDLPANILLYFLTMVPLPQKEDSKSVLLDIIKKSQNPICENIRPVLLEYLNRNIPPLIPLEKKTDNNNAKKESEPIEILEDSDQESVKEAAQEDENKDPDFVKPTKQSRTRQKRTQIKPKEFSCNSLLDLCMGYIVKNQSELQKTYKKVKNQAWKYVYDNAFTGDELNDCYSVIRDINRKEKWLRAIENDDITHEILSELFGDSDVFVQELNLVDDLNDDPFIVTPVLQKALDRFIRYC